MGRWIVPTPGCDPNKTRNVTYFWLVVFYFRVMFARSLRCCGVRTSPLSEPLFERRRRHLSAARGNLVSRRWGYLQLQGIRSEICLFFPEVATLRDAQRVLSDFGLGRCYSFIGRPAYEEASSHCFLLCESFHLSACDRRWRICARSTSPCWRPSLSV